MVNFQEYKAYNGNILFAENQTQLLWNNWISEPISDLSPMSLYNYRSVDNTVENGNIYLANYANNKVLKLTDKKEKIKEISLEKPIFVSCNNLITSDGIKDEGAWVLNLNGDLIKYNENLEILLTVKGFSNKCFIAPNFYGQCIVSDDDLETIFLIDRDGQIISFIYYDELIPSINNSNKILQIKCDINSNIFVLTGQYLYKLQVSENLQMSATGIFDFAQQLTSPPVRISDMDIDFLPFNFSVDQSSSSVSELQDRYQDIYVAGGDTERVLILNLDQNLILKRSRILLYEFPFAIKVAKNKNANHIGLLTDKNKFIEPANVWESSSSTSSSSSIDYSNIYASNALTTNILNFNTDNFNVINLNNHIVIGSKAITYNSNNNCLYYISNITNEIYYYNFASKTNIYIANAPASDIDRITISPDKTKLWLSKNNTLWICNISTGNVLHTIELKQNELGPIEPYGGIAIHPNQVDFYLASGESIYKGLVSQVNVANSVLVLNRIANKPFLSNYITDIAFSNEGEMIISDNYENKSKIYIVNYQKSIVTYFVINSPDILIEGLTNTN